MKIQAAVTESKGAPFTIEDLDLDEPLAGEIVVRMVAAGVCHSDMSARDQYAPFPLPMVLGHEGAGVVEKVGAGVTKLVVGDHVVLSRMTCGTCPDCLNGRSNFCVSSGPLNSAGCRSDGSTGLKRKGEAVYGQFFGQSSFSTYALAHERNATKLDPAFDLSLAPAFACGVLTGAGAVLNGLRPEAGTSIAIFGAGTVGLAAMLAARLRGCTMIIVIDRIEARLELAKELGATHVVRAGEGSSMLAVRELMPSGVDYSIEATGVPDVARAAVDSLRSGGHCGLLGVGPAEQEIGFNHMQVALMGISISGFPTGLSEPDVIIPRLIELYRQGRFPIDRLIKTYSFGEIEMAVRESTEGKTIKPVLLF